jgi:hypothetical protein
VVGTWAELAMDEAASRDAVKNARAGRMVDDLLRTE